jgi:hypothetical protein
MAVVLKGFPENKLTEEQSKKIQQAVLGEVWKCDPGTGPQFKNSYAQKGVEYISITCEKHEGKVMFVGEDPSCAALGGDSP